MATSQRVVRKSLAGEEDIVWGEDTETQTRNGADYVINKVRTIKPVNSLTELNALDTAKFSKAALFDAATDTLTIYSYDVGAGLWDKVKTYTEDETKNYTLLATLIADSNITAGMTARVKERADSLWDISASGVADGYRVIALSNGLFATLRTSTDLIPEQWGVIATANGVTTYATTNLAVYIAMLAYLNGKGGTIQHRAGYYYVSGKIPVTMSGVRFLGAGLSFTSTALNTHIATTSTTEDVIAVNDSIVAVEGFSMERIAVVGNVSGGTTGHGLSINATNGNAISIISIKMCAFLSCKEHGMYWNAPSGSFIFNAELDNIMLRSNGKSGGMLTGQISQVKVGQVYTESNVEHGFRLLGTVSGQLKNIHFDRISLSVVPSGYAGFYAEFCDHISVGNVYSEDVTGENMRLLSVKNFNVIGGSLQQVIAGSKGILIGTDASNNPNKDITIDIPGWTKASAENYIDLTAYTGGVVVDGLYLGRNIDNAFSSTDVTGYDTVFQADRIRFLYEDFRRLPSVAINANAGTSASVAFTAGRVSTDRKGSVTLTHGSAAWAIGAQLRVTFAAPHDNPPAVHIFPEDTDAADHVSTNKPYVTTTKEYFELTYNVAASAADVTQWGYTVVGHGA